MRRINNFKEANSILAKFYRNARTKYELDNMRRFMAHLDNPQDKFKSVHVAGTSGKTSTAYYMSALLTAAGLTTGLTVSPHIDEINERVQINGRPLSEKEFCRNLEDFLTLVEDSPVRPSWFEVLVAFAYWYFALKGVDYVVVEVGLGGLKDGTNVISRSDKVCIITDIGYDHVHVLGETLAAIAAQKAGIIQPGNQVFTYNQASEIMKVLETGAGRQKAQLQIIDERVGSDSAADAGRMPKYQARNWYLTYSVYGFLEQRDNLHHLTSQVLRQTRQILVPGRMEEWAAGNKTVVMDGAHNVQKIRTMIDSFRHQYPGQKPAILLALRSGKEYQQVAALLAAISDHVIVTTFETSQDVPVKSMAAPDLAEAFTRAGTKQVQVVPNHHQALAALLKSPEPLCLITGSFYLLSQIRNNGQLG